MPTHPDVLRLEEAITQNTDMIVELRAQVQGLAAKSGEDGVKRGVAAALKEFRDDPETIEVLGAAFSGHLSDRFYRWVGERVIVGLFLVSTTAVLVWASLTGKFK